jgi:hypothetical protein
MKRKSRRWIAPELPMPPIGKVLGVTISLSRAYAKRGSYLRTHMTLHGHCASFDRLRMRLFLRGTI